MPDFTGRSWELGVGNSTLTRIQKQRELVDGVGVDHIGNARGEIVAGRHAHSAAPARKPTTRGAGAIPVNTRARCAPPCQPAADDSQAIVTPPALRASRSAPTSSATVSLPSTLRARRNHVVAGKRR